MDPFFLCTDLARLQDFAEVSFSAFDMRQEKGKNA